MADVREDVLYDETTPLLVESNQRAATPLPKLQLLTLCLARLADPISMTSIFPYINQMLADLNVAERPSQIGWYSGFVDSIFSVAQLVSIYFYGRLSDRIGRKPVILLGLLGVCISNILFGLSRTFTIVVVTRSLAGALSGNIAVIHSVLGEITDSTNEAMAFSAYGTTYPLGAIIGPIIGGALARPANRFSLFHTRFWKAYPYFLPCLVASCITGVTIIVGMGILKETLPAHCRKKEEKDPCTETVPIAPSNSRKSLLSDPPLRKLAVSGFFLSFVEMSFEVVFTLFCYTPVESGGLGYSPSEIGWALCLAGLLSALFQLFCLPILLAYIRPAPLYEFTNALWPLTFLMLPFVNVAARISGTSNGLAVWAGITVLLAISRVACLAFSLSMILTKNNAPSRQLLGSANGLIQSSMCLARAISPAFVSALFAYSIDNQILGGQLVWIIMSLVGIVGIWISVGMKDSREESKGI